MYNDERAADAKTRSKQALTVGEGSDNLFWGTPKQCKKKSGRESFFGRWAAGRPTGGPRLKIQILFLHLAGTSRV
jgi:hypothetical protein